MTTLTSYEQNQLNKMTKQKIIKNLNTNLFPQWHDHSNGCISFSERLLNTEVEKRIESSKNGFLKLTNEIISLLYDLSNLIDGGYKLKIKYIAENFDPNSEFIKYYTLDAFLEKTIRHRTIDKLNSKIILTIEDGPGIIVKATMK